MKTKTSKTTVIDLSLEDIRQAVEHWMNTVHRVDVSKFQFDFHFPGETESPGGVTLTFSKTVGPFAGKEIEGEKEYANGDSAYDQ